MTINKIKTRGALVKRCMHDYRVDEVPNADKKLEDLNKILVPIKNGTNYIESFNHRISQLDYYIDHDVRKNGVIALDVEFTFSSEAIGDMSEKMEDWEQANVKWLEKTFGRENIISVVIHNDETTPHGHAMVVCEHEGKLNASHYMGNRSKLIDLQNSYGEAMEGFGLHRGVRGSRASHKDIKKFYNAVNSILEKHAPDILPEETIEHYRDRINEIIEKLNLQNMGLKNKVETYEKQAMGYHRSIDEKNAEIKEYKKKANSWDLLSKGISRLSYEDQIKTKDILNGVIKKELEIEKEEQRKKNGTR